MKEGQISFRQLAVCAVVLTLSPASRLLPKAALELGGRACWAAVLPAAGLLLLMLLTVRALLQGCPGGLFQALEDALGRIGGRAAAGLLGLWLSFYCGFILRSGAERLLSTVYESGSLWFFLLSMAAVALVPALSRVATAVRMAELCALLLAPVLLLLFTFALPEVNGDYLLPLNPLDAGGVAAAALPITNVCSLWVYLGFLGKYVKPGGSVKKHVLRCLAFVLPGVLLAILTTVGILGPESAKRQQYPFFVMISNLKLFNVLERVEPLIVLVWVLADFALLGALLLSAAEAFRDLAGLQSRRVPVLLCGAAMTAASFLLAPNAFALEWLSDRLVPIVNLSLTLPLPALLLAIKKIKARRKQGNDR